LAFLEVQGGAGSPQGDLPPGKRKAADDHRHSGRDPRRIPRPMPFVLNIINNIIIIIIIFIIFIIFITSPPSPQCVLGHRHVRNGK
jgi:hypothetical protein